MAALSWGAYHASRLKIFACLVYKICQWQNNLQFPGGRDSGLLISHIILALHCHVAARCLTATSAFGEKREKYPYGTSPSELSND